MRTLQRVILGLGLVIVVPVGGTAAFANKPAQTETKTARPVVKRWYNPAQKKALPASYQIGNNTYVSQQEYADLAGGVKELLKRYDPKKYFFVGVGRDPAPVIAFLQNLGEKNLAVNLPGTSNIVWANSTKPGDAVVTRHIEAAIPEHILTGNREIVILDVTSSGKTPAVFGPYLERYLADRGINKKVHKIGFSWVNIKQAGMSYANTLTDYIDTSKWADFSNYYTGKYENGVGEHERHQMNAPNVMPPTTTRPEYGQFRAALAERMEQDQSLDSFLVENKLVGTPEEMRAWSKQLKIEQAAQRKVLAQQLIQQRKQEKIAKLLQAQQQAEAAKAAHGAAAKLKGDIDALVATIPAGSAGHKEGYFSESGALLNNWLVGAIATQQQADTLNPTLKQGGPNAVTLRFITDTIETAVQNKQIRRRDYRRLLGHALGYTVLDEGAIATLSKQFKKSKDMQRELTEESDYYLKGSSKMPPGTQQTMIANYTALQNAIGFKTVEKKEKEEGGE